MERKRKRERLYLSLSTDNEVLPWGWASMQCSHHMSPFSHYSCSLLPHTMHSCQSGVHLKPFLAIYLVLKVSQLTPAGIFYLVGQNFKISPSFLLNSWLFLFGTFIYIIHGTLVQLITLFPPHCKAFNASEFSLNPLVCWHKSSSNFLFLFLDSAVYVFSIFHESLCSFNFPCKYFSLVSRHVQQNSCRFN